MTRLLPPLAALAFLALLAAACGDEREVVEASDAPFVPVIETHRPAIGDSRIAFTLLDRDRRPSFAAETQFRARFFEAVEGGVRFRADAGQVERIDVAGEDFFIARDLPFDRDGEWAVSVTAAFADGRSQTSPRLRFRVFQHGPGPDVGEPAPQAETPTARDAELSRLTGDPQPLDALYARSAADLAGREPFVILFATWARCAGRPTCARAVAQLRGLAQRIAAVHVEPFPAHRGPELQPKVDAAVAAWEIEAEPIFYVIDADGIVRSRIQAAATDAELARAVDAVLR